MKRTYGAFLLSFALLAGPAAGAPGGGHGQGRGDREQARVERQANRQQVKQNRASHRATASQRHQVRAERHQASAQRHEARAQRHQVRAERHAARADRQQVRAQRHQVRADRKPARVERHAARAERHQARAERHVARAEHRVAAAERHQARAERRQAAVVDRGARHAQRRTDGAERVIRQQREAVRERMAVREDRDVFDRQPRTLRQERAAVRAERAQRAERFVTREQRQAIRVERERVAREERVLRSQPAAFPGPRRFRGLDRDGDGVIARAEWRGNNRSFANHDWNGDGILDGNEVVPAGARTRVARVERFAFLERFVPLPRRFVAPVPIEVATVDLAPVGFVPLPPLAEVLPLSIEETRLEAVFRTDGFGPVDVAVSRLSFTSVDRVLVNDRFVFLDSNRDRFVTYDEWAGPRPVFRTLDLNRDRYLSHSELIVTRPFVRNVTLVDRDRYIAFALLDVDDDGVVAPWEWTGDMDVFFLLDVNGNGVLGRSEYLGLVRTRPVPVRLIARGALDLDHNGYVDRCEWVGDPYRFVSLDLNDDGRLRPYEAVTGSLLIRI